MLLHLERANLFLVPLDSHREWFRYHALFASLLRQRLLETAGAQAVQQLQRRAAEWFQRHGSTGEAIDLALGAQDFERAASLVEREMPALEQQGRVATLAAWLNALPVELVAARPRLGLAQVWTLFFEYQYDQAEARLQQIQANCRRRLTPCWTPRRRSGRGCWRATTIGSTRAASICSVP
jgi:LuxR family maltose regulon positive regulatory protein